MDKEKQKVYCRTYNYFNKERISLQRKQQYRLHPEKFKSRRKAWAEAHPEKIKEWGRIYRKANPEKVNAYNNAWRKANPGKVKIQQQNCHQANPGKRRENRRKQRALKRTRQIQPINEKIVYLRDGWICQHCKKRLDKRLRYPNLMSASLDHIIPLSKGGTHTYANVQLAHLVCNIGKKNRLLPQGEQLRMF